MTKRGAPLGNKNALKHGFYSKQMRATEAEDLEALMDASLSNEINMLRVLLRRTLEIAEGQLDVDTTLSILNAAGANMTRLANLMKTQKFLAGESTDDFMKTLSEALNEVVKELAEEE